MGEDNHNEAESLFATRRKKQQDEEAQRAAQKAEEERLAELERQKQQVEEDLKKLEELKALQKQQADLEAQRAQAEREALAAQKAQAEAEAQRVRAEREAFARAKAQAELEAQKAREEQRAIAAQQAKAEKEAQKALRAQQREAALQKAQEEAAAAQQARAEAAAQQRAKAENEIEKDGTTSPLTVDSPKTPGSAPGAKKKLLPFILAGVGVIAAVVVAIIVINAVSGSKDKKGSGSEFASLLQEVDWYRKTDDSGVSFVYPSIFDEGIDYENDNQEYYYYINEESGQIVSMFVRPMIASGEESMEEADAVEILDYYAASNGLTDYNIYRSGDNIWYICTSFEDVDEPESICGMYIGNKDDDIFLTVIFDVTRENEGSGRFVDSGDMLTLFKQIFDHLSVG